MSDRLIAGFAAAQHRRGLRQGTITERRRLLTRVAKAVDLVTGTAADIETWLDSCDIGSRSRSCYLANLSTFFDWMVDAGERPDNPAAKIPRPRLQRLLPRPAAAFDLQRGVDVADPRMRAWLFLAAYQGLRCFEIVGLRREAILDGQNPAMLIVEDGKGGKQRVLPLNPIVLEALRVYGMPAHGPLFTVRGGKQMPAGTLSSYVARFCRAERIPVTAHNFRHFFGTACYRKSRDIRMVQELLGHSDPTTTAGYAAWSPLEAIDIVNSLGDPND